MLWAADAWGVLWYVPLFPAADGDHFEIYDEQGAAGAASAAAQILLYDEELNVYVVVCCVLFGWQLCTFH
jgi:hypothetical protein